jgi:hypothetical protein
MPFDASFKRFAHRTVRSVLALFREQLQLLDNFTAPLLNLTFVPFVSAAALERIVDISNPKYLFGRCSHTRATFSVFGT